MLKKHLYKLLILSAWLLSACNAWIYEYPNVLSQTEPSEPLVYLAITRAAHADGKESINTDVLDYEDRVHSMALFVFDAENDDLITSYFEDNIPISNKINRFVISLTPGQRDFYFIANMPMAALSGLNTKAEVEAYLQLARDLDATLYQGASLTMGFPMSRIYLNQTVNKGGNALTPDPFKPLVNGVVQDKVKLERVTAKLEVKFSGSAEAGVKKIYFKNAKRQYSLVSQALPSSTYYTAVEEMKRLGNSYIYYMPEALIESGTWNDLSPAPINYFLIETLEGTFYTIPIISSLNSISADEYLDFATGKKINKPNYSIYRNSHYLFTINNLQQLELTYQIDPWNMVYYSTFMGYGYNITIDDSGQLRVENTVAACGRHEITLKTQGSFKFDDDDTEKLFDDPSSDAAASYIITPVPQEGDGDYLEVYYNDVLVKLFSK